MRCAYNLFDSFFLIHFARLNAKVSLYLAASKLTRTYHHIYLTLKCNTLLFMIYIYVEKKLRHLMRHNKDDDAMNYNYIKFSKLSNQ